MRATLRPIVLLIIPALLAACGDGDDEQSCTALAAASLAVVVTDATTSQRICDATVVATDAQGTDYDLDAWASTSDCSYVGPYERDGAFSITVSKTGFTTQTMQGVNVTKGACHVVQENVQVALQAL